MRYTLTTAVAQKIMTAQVRRAVDHTGMSDWLAAQASRFTVEDHALLARAVDLVQDVVAGHLLPSGEPLLNHAREVAQILGGLPMDGQSVAAGLLSSFAMITADWKPRIARDYGDEMARLLEGVQHMARIQTLRGQVEVAAKQEDRATQLEALRKMLLVMVQDVRVVVIKLADQTQQMRFIAGRGSVEDRDRAARDTLDLFAPLANRLGIWQLKWELEDLAFRCQDPETYKRIAHDLDEKRVDRERFIAKVTETLREALHDEGIDAQVLGRPKHIHSIYNKLKRKDQALKDLFDVRGVRILVDSIKDCYAALGLVHNLWTPLPKEFDDYIAKPKPNNYRSLHTAVVGPEGRVLEVQFRTHEMHTQCELGVAAHWRYKEGARREGARDMRYDGKIAWLRQILDWREGLSNVGDLAAHFRTELFDDTIYVLTPQGRVVDLPKGATPVDFAYHVHTELGHRCRGARVNGAMVPLHHALKNGQTVEIIAAKVGGPSRDWLNAELHFVASGRARAKVRQWFNAQNHDAAVAQGRQWVERELHRLGMSALNLDALAKALELADVETLYLAAGRGDVMGRAFERAARALLRGPADPASASPQAKRVAVTEPSARQDGVLVLGVDRLLTALARCCKPMPPDPIVGFITRGRGVTVHRVECDNARRLNQERLVEVQWGSAWKDERFVSDIAVTTRSDTVALREILDLMARERIAVLASSTSARGGEARHVFTVEVGGGEQMGRLVTEIARVPCVLGVRRQ